MKLGSAIALIAVGAILAFAVQDSIPGVDLEVAGYILMAAGALGALILSFIAGRKPKGTVSETRSLTDTQTGETITRAERQDI